MGIETFVFGVVCLVFGVVGGFCVGLILAGFMVAAGNADDQMDVMEKLSKEKRTSA